MVKERPDWCISRQRDWGSRSSLSIARDAMNPARARDRALCRRLFEKEGADAWYARPPAELLPTGTRCANAAAAISTRSTTSWMYGLIPGSTHLAALGHRPDMPWPADLYIEGGDQYQQRRIVSMDVGQSLREIDDGQLG